MSKDCRARRNGSNKKFEEAEKAIEEDELVLCSLMMDNKKEKNTEKKKVRFVENEKQSSETGMICTIDGTSFHSFTKNTWIDNSGASCHIANDENGMYEVIEINESIQGSSDIMPATKKGKLRVTVRQVNGQEQVHTLWPVKFCPTAGANLFLLMCELLQGHKISSDNANNIVVITPNGDIILDHQIKTCDRWIAGVDFIRNAVNKKVVTATAPIK